MGSPVLPLDQRTILHLGAGKKYNPNAVNVDLVAGTNPDVVHDLDQMPWPLPSDRFTEIQAMDVIEHLNDVVAVMEEIHRVATNGAIVRITVPHFSSANAFTDITHRHWFSVSSFDYFTGESPVDFYTSRRFRKRSAQIVFFPSLVNKLVWRYAKRWPSAYESKWAWMFPAWFLSFELEVRK